MQGTIGGQCVANIGIDLRLGQRYMERAYRNPIQCSKTATKEVGEIPFTYAVCGIHARVYAMKGKIP